MPGRDETMKWFIQNWATCVVIAASAALVTLAVIKIVKDRRAGRSSCGCGCSSCPMSGSCHKENNAKTDDPD